MSDGRGPCFFPRLIDNPATLRWTERRWHRSGSTNVVGFALCCRSARVCIASRCASATRLPRCRLLNRSEQTCWRVPSRSKTPRVRQALLTLQLDGRTLLSRTFTVHGGRILVPLGQAREKGMYQLTVSATTDKSGPLSPTKSVSMALELPAAKPDLKLSSERSERIAGVDEITDVNRTIRGLHVCRAARFTTATAKIGIQDDLPGLMASVDPEQLTFEAGTTRKIEGVYGAAAAGLEIDNLRRVRLRPDQYFPWSLPPARRGPAHFAIPRDNARVRRTGCRLPHGARVWQARHLRCWCSAPAVQFPQTRSMAVPEHRTPW